MSIMYPVANRSADRNPARRPAPVAEQDEAKKRVLNRLRRAYGQLGAVIEAVESDSDCRTVVTQLAAVSAAVERAGFAVVATGMKRCLSTPGHPGATEDDLSLDDLEKLFMMLS